MKFLTSLSQLQGLKELTLTTNGVLTAPHVAELKRIGVSSVNLSLDTLDSGRFFSITKRDEFSSVMATFDELLKHNIDVKVNAVVMDGKNTQDIIPLIELTKKLPVSVRFIEEMPFNGDGHVYTGLKWDHVRILDEIRGTYADIKKLHDPQYSTSCNYQVPGHKGSIGIIAAYSRTFCGTCNRIRITPEGELKTCLYDNGVMNIKDQLRQGISEDNLKWMLLNTFNSRAKDGWAAERQRTGSQGVHESMATIGG
jgi:cyclic pyranopterin phosphate synthase